ncbi:hypothetical protein RRG08_013045 [Elysia crispata]|uniref:Uncharacterized protein n=1 Tax=Elysia crispata TaxID=231223 RepID=A0AAE1A036_9GAST|nr:hypothetical protein RRG08_013045 [Elysia crispata]
MLIIFPAHCRRTKFVRFCAVLCRFAVKRIDSSASMGKNGLSLALTSAKLTNRHKFATCSVVDPANTTTGQPKRLDRRFHPLDLSDSFSP